MNLSIIEEVVEQLKVMPQLLPRHVLEFDRSLVQVAVRGTLGQQLLRFAGLIPFDDLRLMRAVIKQDYEWVNLDTARSTLRNQKQNLC